MKNGWMEGLRNDCMTGSNGLLENGCLVGSVGFRENGWLDIAGYLLENG